MADKVPHMAMFKNCRHVRKGDPPNNCGCTWYGQFRISGGPPRQINLGASTKDARKEYARLERQHKRDRGAALLARAGQPTLKDLTGAFYDVEESRGLAPGSLAALRTRLGALRAYFGDDTPPMAVGQADIIAWRIDMRGAKLSPTYERDVLATSRKFLAWAAQEGHIASNPWPEVWTGLPTRTRQKRRPRHHPIAEMHDAIEQTREPYGDVCELMMLTSLRCAEALGLRPDDVVMKGRKPVQVRITGQFDLTERTRVDRVKTGDSERVIDLTPRASQIIAARLKAQQGAPSKDGRLWPFVHHTINKHWQRGQTRAGLSPVLGTHSLRHAYRSIAEAAGVPDREIAKVMGHGDRVSWSRDKYGTGNASLNAGQLTAIDATAQAALRPARRTRRGKTATRGRSTGTS